MRSEREHSIVRAFTLFENIHRSLKEAKEVICVRYYYKEVVHGESSNLVLLDRISPTMRQESFEEM